MVEDMTVCTHRRIGGECCILILQVAGGVSGGGHHTAAEGHIMFIGNICLLINTLASAVYYLGAKKLVQVRPACFKHHVLRWLVEHKWRVQIPDAPPACRATAPCALLPGPM